MPYTVEWEEPAGVHVRLAGMITPDDFAGLIRDVTSDARFDNLRYTIADYRDATGSTFVPGDLPSMAASAAEAIGSYYSNPRIIEAAIATEPGMVQLARDYGAVTRFPFALFDSEDAAREWIAGQTMSLRCALQVPLAG